MTKHRHRLSRLPNRAIRTLQGMPVLSVNNIGAVTQRLSGMIVGESVEALPDSGSEPNLLSLDYVIRRGFDKLMNTNDLRMIQFADGTVQKTMGSVWLNWAYAGSLGDDGDDEWSEHFVEFHVLDGCAYDVIIGQDALEDADAFITHEGSFMDLDMDSEPSGLNLVIWASNGHHEQAIPPGAGGIFSRDWIRVGRRRRSFSPPSATDQITQTPSPLLDGLPRLNPETRLAPPGFTSAALRDYRREELERRAEEERKYRQIPHGPEREAAVAREEERQRQYDMVHHLLPTSDVSSESDSGHITSNSAVGARRFLRGSGFLLATRELAARVPDLSNRETQNSQTGSWKDNANGIWSFQA
ncbi:hypothetical protein CSUB01_06357 [Colletotrichum sublineola]|uniref:Uncharacterized protein n=1 Tax=Colletotrichum sublineola TaxID=1173701 RepID=A0A066X2Y1_COLSU|nr:hypothetical protein CSUB01_06357 [Colletotrichum sublineola]